GVLHHWEYRICSRSTRSQPLSREQQNGATRKKLKTKTEQKEAVDHHNERAAAPAPPPDPLHRTYHKAARSRRRSLQFQGGDQPPGVPGPPPLPPRDRV
uniref:Uncharacterized protein n=1 Tax=Aegilops tauschii subsp. strangulata TaxID=200361 RepID=A0A453CPJ1_AEGTS